MITSIDTFRLLWPAYAGVSDGDVTIMIGLTAPEFDAGKWGNYYLQGLLALVAHKLEIRARSAAAAGATGGPGSGLTQTGAVASRATGDVSIGFGSTGTTIAGGGAASQGDAVYATTAGGMEYLRLRGRCVIGMTVV